MKKTLRKEQTESEQEVKIELCVFLPDPEIENKMKYLTHTHKESYTLVARKRYMKNLLYVWT